MSGVRSWRRIALSGLASSLVGAAFCLLPALGAPRRATEQADEFAKYPSKLVSSGTTERVVVERQGPNESSSAFIERVKTSAGSRASFAGRHAVVLWSCGFICLGGGIVDVETRAFHWLPFVTAGECESLPGKLLDFKPESMLLIVRGSVGTPDSRKKTFRDSKCGVYKYLWTGGEFKRISAPVIE